VKRAAPLVIGSFSPTKSATRTRSSRRRGLDGKVGVVDRGKTFRVGAGRQKSSNLGLGRLHATRQDQSGIPQVNEGDGATFRNAPTVAKFSRKARLSTIRNLCRHDSSHRCIVRKLILQCNMRHSLDPVETLLTTPHRTIPEPEFIVSSRRHASCRGRRVARYEFPGPGCGPRGPKVRRARRTRIGMRGGGRSNGREKAVVFDRKADAERWLDNVRGDLVRGTYVDPGAGRELFQEVAERWLSIQVHRPTTAAQVRSNFDNHVLPAFGDRPIGTIRPSEVQAWVRELTSRLAPGTVEVIYRYLAAVFRAAVEDRVIAVSPCRGVKLPKIERIRIQPLTTEEIAARDRRRRRPLPGSRDPGCRHRLAPRRSLRTDRAPSRPVASPAGRGAAAHHVAGSRLRTSLHRRLRPVSVRCRCR
jgi:hypothetical protein